jgi:phosphoribosylformylglycinamidine synthase subunit PurL
VVRVHGTGKALAFTSDVTPRYVKANPFEGGKQAVAEAYRNLTCGGREALGHDDNLNFGNPEKPEIMGQFVGAIKGIGAAVKAWTCPSCRGTCRFTTRRTARASCPRRRSVRWGSCLAGRADRGRRQTGDIIVVIGETRGHLGQSALLAEAFGIEAGEPASMCKAMTASTFRPK